MMRKLFKHWPLLLAALLALCCAFCLWRLHMVSVLLPSQQAAQRWKGVSERDFAQISVFMPSEQKLTRDQLYAFRNDMFQKLKGASFDLEKEKGLYADACCCTGTVKISSGRQSGEVLACAVTGNFFDFHPLRLLSGNYLRPGDVMDDRVLLDREAAWLLFGSADVAGMSFSLNGTPFVVAGVYEHERDAFSRRAFGDGMGIYMDFDMFTRLFPDGAGITCYELVMVEPVKGFAGACVQDKFPIKKAEIVENSYRFDVERLFRLLRSGSERSMRRSSAVYPYWENAARAAEDRAVLWLTAALVTGALPGALTLYWAIRLAVLGKRRMEDEVLPATKKKTKEFVRAQSRRRWEKKHPDEPGEDDWDSFTAGTSAGDSPQEPYPAGLSEDDLNVL